VRVSGTRVLLTGATGGIGEALATAFAEAGATLVLSGRRDVELKELADRTGGTAVVADLAERADVERLLEEAGPVDVLVANAALPAAGLLEEFTAEQVDRALEVNLRAPIAMAHALAPGMVARRTGALVFVSSLAGLTATSRSSLYNATKFGLRGFALGLRQDLHGTGVGVSVVLPGFVSDAGMFAASGATPPPGFGTRSPQQVAHATLGAVHRDRGEVLVAPALDRVGARIGGLVPGVAARLGRMGAAADVTAQIAAGARDKR
jgi:short-subunit dehydrogenase